MGKHGDTIDFPFSPARDAKAAKRLAAKALGRLRASERPAVMSTDETPTYAATIVAPKKEGKLGPDTQHRQLNPSSTSLRPTTGQAQAPDQDCPWFPIPEGSLCHHQRLQGHESAQEGPGISLPVPARRCRRDGLGASDLRPNLIGHGPIAEPCFPPVRVCNVALLDWFITKASVDLPVLQPCWSK